MTRRLEAETPDSPDFRDRYVNLRGVEVNIQGTPLTSDTHEKCGKCGTILYRVARDDRFRCANENCEDSATRLRRTEELERFRAYMHDANAFIAYMVHVRKVIAEATRPFARLSDLLFATMTSDDQTLGKIALVLEMRPLDLLHIRDGLCDPMFSPPHALALLWQALGVEAVEFKRLLEGDEGKLVSGLAVRGARPSHEEAWDEIVRAHHRLEMDNPDATSGAT